MEAVSTGVAPAERREVFELIAAIVGENYEAGRRSFGASIKPELRKRTFGQFSESKLGFRRFTEILFAVEAAGLISLHPAPRGPDKEAVPPGEGPLSATPPTNVDAGVSTRVRHDLWKAFVDWNAAWRRVYDRTEARAYLVPAKATSFEPAAIATVRSSLEVDPDRFVEIAPVSMAQQLAWMHEFTVGVGDTYEREKLEQALGSERPAQAFVQNLDAKPRGSRDAWRVHFARQVRACIDEWAKSHGLEVDPVEPAAARQEFQTDDREKARLDVDPVHTERTAQLRALARRAVDRMPESELRALRIPLEYLVD